MSRLGCAIDGMIGIDPHRDTQAAAATDPVGGLLAQTSASADAAAAAHRGPRATPWTPSARRGRPSPTTISWRRVVVVTGRRCGCCCRHAKRLRRQGQRHQSAQGADRGSARGAAGRAPRARDQAADRVLRHVAGAAGPVARAPHDRAGAALDRPPRPAAGRRGRRAPGRVGPPGRCHRSVAARAARYWTNQRRPGAGQLVTC
jgi:hypothetical protein